MRKLTGHYKKQPCHPDTGGHDSDGKSSGQRTEKAVFFDVDGTLIRGDSQALEARYRLGRRRFSKSYLWSIIQTLGALQLNRIGWISLTRQNEVYLKSYRGQTREELARQAEEVFQGLIGGQLFPGALERLEMHRQKGDLVVLVSATTRHLLRPFEKCLGPDYVFGTELEFNPDGRCTGRAVGGICAEEKKAAVVRRFARRHKLDLSACYAYSDHHADLPFLSAVGHPAAINPTLRLVGHCRSKGWPIYRFDEKADTL